VAGLSGWLGQLRDGLRRWVGVRTFELGRERDRVFGMSLNMKF
jgi:hypothetical protein